MTAPRDTLRVLAGRSNSLDIIAALPGERIIGAFQDVDGAVVIITASGVAFVCVSIGGSGPAFWVEDARRWETRLAAIRREMKQLHDGLGALIAAAPEATDD